MPNLGIVASSISGHLIPPSSFYSIATVTAAGGETSLSFTSIPSTYKSLQIRYISKCTRTGGSSDDLKINYNSDTSANYTRHILYGDAVNVVASGVTGASYIGIANGTADTYSGLTNDFAAGIIDIIDYANTSKNKTLRAFTGNDLNGLSGLSPYLGFTSGLWLSTSAITSIVIASTSPIFAAGSTFALYGVK